MIKKSLFTLWKLGSIKKSKYLFCNWFVFLDWYSFQLNVILKPDSNCLNSFTLFWVDAVTNETSSFVSVLVNAGTWFAVAPATKKQSLDHFNLRIIL